MNYTIDDVYEILEQVCKEIPRELFQELNGGIILLDEILYHDKSIDDSLLVLANYARFGVRKQINIYYQSIKKIYPYLDYNQLYEKLSSILRHEIQHHTEYRAKLRDLEIEDEIFINRYLDEKNKNKEDR